MNEDRENYIVKEDIMQTRLLIAEHMRPKFNRFLCWIIVCYMLSEWIPNILGVAFPGTINGFYQGLPPDIVAQMPALPFSAVLYMLLFGGALELGRCYYVMTFLRNRDLEPATILEGMSHYFKATIIGILKGMMMLIGLMLFIIPGLIAFYVYSQSMYILADDPSKGPIQCMRESRMMMSGNKATLLRLDISYLIYLLMCILPSYFIQFTGLIVPGTYKGVLIYLLFRLAAYLGFANWLMGRVTFYEILTSRGFANFKYSGEEVFRNAAVNNEKKNR